jgi:hypothetical protein
VRKIEVKDYIIEVLKRKYEYEMILPAIKIQTMYRHIKTEQFIKYTYFIDRIRERVIKAIIKIQAIIRSKRTQ